MLSLWEDQYRLTKLELYIGVIVLNHFVGQNFYQLTAENLKFEH